MMEVRRGLNRLKEYRARHGVTQFDLQLGTGIRQSRISLAERGYIPLRPEERKKIAEALGQNEAEIWPDDEYKTDLDTRRP